MMRKTQVLGWFWWFTFAGASPAYANNPPAPDGILSLILIFPVVILGLRLSGAQLGGKWRLLKGTLLALTTLAAVGGSEVGFCAMLILLFYGLKRGSQAVNLGKGWRRIAGGIVIIVFSFSAAANYMFSLSTRNLEYVTESRGVQCLREVVRAEERFRSSSQLDADKNGVPEYGRMDQLRQSGVLPGCVFVSRPPTDYSYVIVVTGVQSRDEKVFFAYASPANYGGRDSLGISLLDSFRSQPKSARRTFATDESGELRGTDIGDSRPVTREEAQKWPAY